MYAAAPTTESLSKCTKNYETGSLLKINYYYM